MANMLIRTRHAECKPMIAVAIRVFFFFAIPTFYLLFLSDKQPGQEPAYDITSTDNHVFSRRLLGVSALQLNCTSAAILEFPPDGFTHTQRRNGFILLHCLLAVYLFLLLGVVCEQYFVPSIEMICDKLEMEEDIAGATFMAAASSSPELFINCVGTFVTEGDLGVGAIVGSAVFNVLAVPACCGLIAGKAIELDWWSVSRDCLMYAVAVVALILTLLDGRILWYEAMMLVLMYTFYILAMVFNRKLGSLARSGCCGFKKQKMYTEITPLLIDEKNNRLDLSRRMSRPIQRDVEEAIELDDERVYRKVSSDSATSSSSVWSWPGESSVSHKLYWLVTWPLGLMLWMTIPDCRRHPKMFPFCFIMCVLWIGGVSYLIAWIITILGDTLNMPDSITGLTILAAGTSLPEAISSVVVTNSGHGSMGISNSIGSNTFDILLCLGLPWFVKSLFYPSLPGNHWVTINSSGMSYSAISLLSTLFALYGCLALNKFQLDWRVGLACTVVYVGFLTLAALIELNVFFVVNLPVCPH